MATERQVRIPDAWRVVVVTMVPGGVVYTMVADVLRPLGHRVIGVLTSPGPPRRRNTSYREVVAAVPPEIDVIVSTHPARWATMLAPLRPDLIICGGMPWRLPPAVLTLPRLGAINIHPALLPRHRGPAAIQWAFRSGDPTLGITIHRIAPDFDTGPILAQTAVPIDDEDDFQTLLAKVGPVIPGLLGQALDRVAQGIRATRRTRRGRPTPGSSRRRGGPSGGTPRRARSTTRCGAGVALELKVRWARSPAPRCRSGRRACSPPRRRMS